MRHGPASSEGMPPRIYSSNAPARGRPQPGDARALLVVRVAGAAAVAGVVPLLRRLLLCRLLLLRLLEGLLLSLVLPAGCDCSGDGHATDDHPLHLQAAERQEAEHAAVDANRLVRAIAPELQAEGRHL